MTCVLEPDLDPVGFDVSVAWALDSTAPVRPYDLAQSSALLPTGQQSEPFAAWDAQ